MKISARNQLKGKIIEVKRGATTAHVRIDGGGQIITASITNESAEELKHRTRALNNGAVGFLSKPFDEESLIKCLIGAFSPSTSPSVRYSRVRSHRDATMILVAYRHGLRVVSCLL
jgi:molybdopterin-binding protein